MPDDELIPPLPGMVPGYVDTGGIFRELPTRPLMLASLRPPCDVEMPDGRMRRIVWGPKPQPT